MNPSFPTPGSANYSTGYINGTTNVDCPLECNLVQNSPIYNKNDYSTHNNVYDVQNIGSYYCQINSGPPLPHTTRPDGYSTQFFKIWSNDWGLGFGSTRATEDEVYTSPTTDYMYSGFSTTSVTCPGNVPPQVPSPPDDPSDCSNIQSSLSWFRLKPNLFK